MSDLKSYLKKVSLDLLQVKKAARKLSQITTLEKNEAISKIAQELEDKSGKILAANKKDMDLAIKQKLAKPKIERLKLTKEKIAKMAADLREIIALPDPIGSGKIVKRPNGLIIEKRHIPLGVIGIIYESRPNVTTDVAGLCLKSGNAVILRGGSEAINSNLAIYEVIQSALSKSAIPKEAVYMIEKTDREIVGYLLHQRDLIDVIIPRGGSELINYVNEHSKIPVISHDRGLCHVYVDETADLKKALSICVNAKCQNPSVCNAAETFLVHEKIATRFLPLLAKELKKFNVLIKGDERVRKIIKAEPATLQDWETEYLDYIISIKIVKNTDEAITHIEKYSSGLAEAIITEDLSQANLFTDCLDSAVLYVNASTRFTDGHEFGKGAEIGIGTNRLHARGPVGLKELTTIKYVVKGDGQIRE